MAKWADGKQVVSYYSFEVFQYTDNVTPNSSFISIIETCVVWEYTISIQYEYTPYSLDCIRAGTSTSGSGWVGYMDYPGTNLLKVTRM